MVLRKTRTKTGAQIEFDLKLYPMLLEEIARVSKETRIGPMIISEHTGELLSRSADMLDFSAPLGLEDSA
jgi:hypothetical protein